MDNVGRIAPPVHYAGAREVIDMIRDALGDALFTGFCRGNVLKYLARAGRKVGAAREDDEAKAAWYLAMSEHVRRDEPDPRSTRPGWDQERDGYRRQEVDLFSGIGGLDLGLERAGLRTATLVQATSAQIAADLGVSVTDVGDAC